jgi:NhaA family Na+:H+ antiporter
MGTVGSPLVLAIIAGLVLGKPLGFLSFSWLATRLGFAQRPEAVTWPMIGAIGALAGIGFTISLFIAGLAFHAQDQRESASLAILIASCCSALVGFAALRSLAGNKDASARD